MARILVAGLINVETTVQIAGFPIEYNPQNFPFFGLHTAVSGVGFNVAAACRALGHQVLLLSLIGSDHAHWPGTCACNHAANGTVRDSV
jgi:sugar/nucleoside kinase (ribokinase family)